MSQQFDVSPIQLRPQPGGAVSIESGEASENVPEKPHEPPKEPPRRPWVPPPWGIRLVRQDQTIAELAPAENSQVDEAERIGTWIQQQQVGDRLEVFVNVPTLTTDELKPLIQVGRHHDLPINVHLLGNG